ncbi:MAG TPA: pilus assembly protein PilM [Candidatus Paceibacterota bacterium]
MVNMGMFTKTFFKLFPPPKFLNIPYAGLDISDDAIRCIEYSSNHHGYTLHRYGTRMLAPGIVEAGYIKNEKALVEAVSSLTKELKIVTVKASLPEERMYLFKTEVADTAESRIRQNIEFKLEENVPLSSADAIFFFDLLPQVTGESKIFASVSVAPRELVNSYLNVLRSSGLTVVSFEIQPKAIARAVVSHGIADTQMIVHIMNKKTGLYVVSAGVVCFTSTISWGGEMMRNKKTADVSDDIFSLRHEIERVYTYWSEHAEGGAIGSIILSGRDAMAISQVSHLSPNPNILLTVANVWHNAFSEDYYVPEISLEDSLDYAVSAGLALPQE